MSAALMNVGAILVIVGIWLRPWDRRNPFIPKCLLSGGAFLTAGWLLS